MMANMYNVLLDNKYIIWDCKWCKIVWVSDFANSYSKMQEKNGNRILYPGTDGHTQNKS